MEASHPLRSYRFRQSPRMSQQALADKLGVGRLTVLRWEKGERKPDEKLLPKIEQETGIPPKDLRQDLIEKHEAIFGEAS